MRRATERTARRATAARLAGRPGKRRRRLAKHPGLIGDLRKFGAEAFGSFAIDAVNVWARMDPKGYRATVEEFVGNYLRDEGFFRCVRMLVSALDCGDIQRAQILARRLLDWAAEFPAAKSLAPRNTAPATSARGDRAAEAEAAAEWLH